MSNESENRSCNQGARASSLIYTVWLLVCLLASVPGALYSAVRVCVNPLLWQRLSKFLYRGCQELKQASKGIEQKEILMPENRGFKRTDGY
eukprot:793254-Amphidinium_carterae.1